MTISFPDQERVLYHDHLTAPPTSELEMSQQQRQWERQKSDRISLENNNFLCAAHFLVHFCGITAWLQPEIA